MPAAASSWSPPDMENNSDLSSHLSALSVDEAHAAGIRQPGGIPPTPPYANVHTPQRPAFPGYDGGGQFLYYASSSVDPATYGAAASAHQAYSYTDLTATPIQSLGSPGGVAYDPYPTPPDNYTTHSPDTRASANQGQPGMSAFQQQIVAAAASARNQTIYRPPQLQPQIHQQVVAQNQVQHGYFAYDRAPYWTHQTPARENNVSGCCLWRSCAWLILTGIQRGTGITSGPRFPPARLGATASSTSRLSTPLATLRHTRRLPCRTPCPLVTRRQPTSSTRSVAPTLTPLPHTTPSPLASLAATVKTLAQHAASVWKSSDSARETAPSWRYVVVGE